MLWFADIRGFTPTTDAPPAPLSSNYLNDAFEVIAATLRAHGGEVLKFLADGESRPSMRRIAR
jgi:adenylate cyclase